MFKHRLTHELSIAESTREATSQRLASTLASRRHPSRLFFGYISSASRQWFKARRRFIDAERRKIEEAQRRRSSRMRPTHHGASSSCRASRYAPDVSPRPGEVLHCWSGLGLHVPREFGLLRLSTAGPHFGSRCFSYRRPRFGGERRYHIGRGYRPSYAGTVL